METKVPAEQRAVFADIVQQHRALVCGVAYSTIGDKALSEEIAQEAFLTAWKKLPELSDPERLPAWLCGIARHLALNARRKNAREFVMESVPEAPSSAPTAFDELAGKESQQLVWKALEDIPSNDREALVLFYRSDKSIKEVALALDLSEEATKQRLSRGRKRLAKSVTKIIEQSLVITRPTAAFTAALMVAFDNAGIAHAATSTLVVGQQGEELAAGSNSSGTILSSKALPALLGVVATLMLVVGVTVLVKNSKSESSSGRPPQATATADMENPVASLEDEGQAGSVNSATPSKSSGPLARGTARRLKGDQAAATTASRSDETERHTEADPDARARLQRKVDLDYAQVDIRDMIRLVSNVAEVDIVTKGDITAMVTMRMRKTPVIEALDEALFQAGARRTEIPVLRIVEGTVAGAHLIEGRNVTASFSDASLAEVIDVFDKHTDISIVVPDELSGRRTSLRFTAEPFGQAFSRFLRESGLGFETSFAFEITRDPLLGDLESP